MLFKLALRKLNFDLCKLDQVLLTVLILKLGKFVLGSFEVLLGAIALFLLFIYFILEL